MWWPLEKNHFTGTLIKIIRNESIDDKNCQPHHIKYDDGDVEWTNLNFRNFDVCKNQPMSSRKHNKRKTLKNTIINGKQKQGSTGSGESPPAKKKRKPALKEKKKRKIPVNENQFEMKANQVPSKDTRDKTKIPLVEANVQYGETTSISFQDEAGLVTPNNEHENSISDSDDREEGGTMAKIHSSKDKATAGYAEASKGCIIS